jgi:hypothetical protein
MATKRFCDLCDKPAMEPSFASIRLGEKTLNRMGYHICVHFTEAKEFHPKTTDEGKDCCEECLANGLEMIVKRLRASAQEKK